MSHHHPLQKVADITLAGGLTTSPAWAPWLDNVNEVLTMLTLLLGIVLAIVRISISVREWRSTKKEKG